MGAEQADQGGPGEPLISLRGVTKVFGEGDAAVHALRGIDLDIHPGEFVAIMGTSGSGKSTAMNILGCLDVPTSGQYLMEGIPVGDLPPEMAHEVVHRDDLVLLH